MDLLLVSQSQRKRVNAFFGIPKRKEKKNKKERK